VNEGMKANAIISPDNRL